MATYSPSLSNQGDEFPTFFEEQKLASYHESPLCPDSNMYLNAPSTAQYLLSLELAGGSESTFKVNSVNNPQGSLSPKDMLYGSNLCELSDLASTNFTSKYFKAAQQLLNEVVNVQSALKQHEFGPDGSVVKSKNCSLPPLSNVMPLDPHESTTKSSCEPSPAERHELQKKMTKLFSMLDEVDRRYKQYYHQMQIVVSSFEMTAGIGTAKPYTALALQTISRHFRCLRDAINSQIQVIRQSLGEQYATPNGQAGGLSRLRYVDHERRQQRALQWLGMTRHSWRPQRGLPETSVSILRAWMFEHFLHPYPKESEKIMLARQTGLTRSQVANWFINARVRLWKPMIEEMYKDEFGDLEADSKSSPENAAKEATDKSWATEDRGEELQGSAISTAAYGGHSGGFNDSNSDFTPNKQINDGDDHGLFPDEIITPNQCGDGNLLAASATNDFSQLGSFGIGNQVSLELQLRHCENDAFPTSGWTQLKQDMGLNTTDNQFTNPVNPRERFGDPHMLPNFVA